MSDDGPHRLDLYQPGGTVSALVAGVRVLRWYAVANTAKPQ